jgi:pentatricopeptide repeat protein
VLFVSELIVSSATSKRVLLVATGSECCCCHCYCTASYLLAVNLSATAVACCCTATNYSACAADGRYEEALQLLEEMRSSALPALKPNVIIYTAAINACAR